MSKRCAKKVFKVLRLLCLIFLISGEACKLSEEGGPPVRSYSRSLNAPRVEAVIIHLNTPFFPEGTLTDEQATQQRAVISAYQFLVEQSLQGTAYRVYKQYTTIPAMALDVSLEARERLQKSPWVDLVSEDQLLSLTAEKNIELIEADQTQANGFGGNAWSIAIIDSGVEAGHVYFGGRVDQGACFSKTNECPGGVGRLVGPLAGEPCTFADMCFHGTHVAGIAAGKQGVAPQANIFPINIASRLILLPVE